MVKSYNFYILFCIELSCLSSAIKFLSNANFFSFGIVAYKTLHSATSSLFAPKDANLSKILFNSFWFIKLKLAG